MLPERILIATPVYDGQVTVEYMASVRGAEAALRGRGVEVDLRFTVGTELWKARNHFASTVLHDRSFSHLLFVDADMQFPASAVARLLARGAPFCGALYPYRALDLGALHREARRTDDARAARNRALDYVGAGQLGRRRAADGSLSVALDDGFARTLHIGCGLLLLQRSVFEAMAAAMPSLFTAPYDNMRSHGARVGDAPERRVLQAFSPIVDAEGTYLSEDLSFCRRWTDGCGGEIWACADEEIGHVGRHVYRGRALDRIAAERDPA